MDITFLGTGSSIPTKDRSHPSVLLEYEGDSVLFDCGEGAQRQFVLAKKSFMKVSKIFITHWHADHFAGLPTLLHSMHLDRRER
ncbi:MAG: MBL fold metallo-hydrolase, partial [Candidatus Aenigmarchaeota archaeon]|nr:MBL fold metallo-hydrolase [Candidatus Aenigmarchaeota archaeon]